MPFGFFKKIVKGVASVAKSLFGGVVEGLLVVGAIGASVLFNNRRNAGSKAELDRSIRQSYAISDRITSSGSVMGVAYGKFGAPGIPVKGAPSATAGGYANIDFAKKKGRDVMASTSPQRTGRKGFGEIFADNADSNWNQFFLCQYAICAGPIHDIKRFVIDDSPEPGGRLTDTYVIECSSLGDNYETASPMASAWQVSQPDFRTDKLQSEATRIDPWTPDHKFTGLSYITCAFYQGDTDDGKRGQYRGVPNVYVIGEGKPVRRLETNESGLAVINQDRAFTVDGVKVGSNTACVLLDVLTAPEFGSKYTDAQINWQSFYRFQQRCGRLEVGEESINDNTKLDPEWVAEAGTRPRRQP